MIWVCPDFNFFIMKVVVGLGNVGQEYDNTRHNVGFVLLDKWLEKMNKIHDRADVFRENKKMNALMVRMINNDQEILLVKPMTYMNLSGNCIQKVLDYYRIDIANLVVVHDDLDLELGRINIKLGGGHAGHHGVESVINCLSTAQFVRLRLGIGKSSLDSFKNKQGIDYVLGKFSKQETNLIVGEIDNWINALECIVGKEITKCMNLFNKKIPNKLPVE